MNGRLRNAMFGGALVAGALVAMPAVAANGNLMQLTIKVVENMAGMAQMPAQTITRKICMAAGRFDPQAMLRAQSGSDCKISNYKMNGKVITFDEGCTRPAAVTAHGEFHLGNGPNFTGTMHTEMNAAGHAISVDSSYVGERIGACEPTPKKG
ncbi:MAG: DUF3617 domain-containing protein [Rhodanobacteraceae bacterium]